EPSFRAIRQGELDYLIARDADELVDKLAALKADPLRFRTMIEHGRDRVKAYNREAVARRWRDLFARIGAEHEGGIGLSGQMLRAARFSAGKLAHPFTRRM
ncbi:MAG TPA: hypothetical protein VLC08_04825, partial [Chitinolyticbacter sp.]|nr:hypothetical protein [Chitinolyticbacter sp.]